MPRSRPASTHLSGAPKAGDLVEDIDCQRLATVRARILTAELIVTRAFCSLRDLVWQQEVRISHCVLAFVSCFMLHVCGNGVLPLMDHHLLSLPPLPVNCEREACKMRRNSEPGSPRRAGQFRKSVAGPCRSMMR